MSRILFLSQLVPYPPDAGPKVRSYYVLRYLAQKHRVTLLAFIRPDDPPSSIEHLKSFCEVVETVPMVRSRLRDIGSMAISWINRRPFVIQRDFVPEMERKVSELLKADAFDAVHADQLWMAQYALSVKSLKPQTRLILDEHNACFQIFQRLANNERSPFRRIVLEREWRALQRYEAQACAAFDHLVTVTQEDQAILSGLLQAVSQTKSAENSTTIPICVDAHGINPVTPAPGSKNVLHMGTMFWLPNVEGVLWFAREVWPRVLTQIPQATFTIIGKNPPESINRLTASDRPDTVIRVLGFVPDPGPFLAAAGVFIVPLLSGGGMRVKIVDAWRWGLPIVSTSIGAEGIQYQDGENILIADGAEQFASAVVQVLCDPDLANRLRVNGRGWVEDHYDWQKVYTAWDSIYPPLSEKIL